MERKSGQTTCCIGIKQCDRTALFYEQSDYQYWLLCIERCVHHHGVQLHAFVLLPDHVQLLITVPDKRLIPRAMDQLEQEYAGHFNFYHRRRHRCLELDYSFIRVDEEQHLLPYTRYIELAPVRSGIVAHPADYCWSSYAANALGEHTGLLTPHACYLALAGDESARRERYRSLFGQATERAVA